MFILVEKYHFGGKEKKQHHRGKRLVNMRDGQKLSLIHYQKEQ